MSKKNELILVRHSKEPADDRVFTFARLNSLTPIEKFPFQGDLLGEPTERTFGTVIYGGMGGTVIYRGTVIYGRGRVFMGGRLFIEFLPMRLCSLA